MYILFLQIGSGNFGELSGMVCLIVLLQKLDSGFFPGTDVTFLFWALPGKTWKFG